MVFYQDKEISSNSKDILLSGGYSGHANFGDILQLKSVISWYKSLDYNPIVIIRLDAIYDEQFIAYLYSRFDVKAFIFYSTTLMDVSKYNLKVSKTFSCNRFHLYGGGMINQFWAKDIIALNESIINKFQVTNYILSGQQIDKVGAMLLVEHFSNYPPCVVGVRDIDSLKNLEACNIEAVYSFDDAYESLKILSTNFIDTESEVQEIYIHFNLSSYVSDSLDNVIKEYIKNIEYLKNRYTNSRYILLLTYLDSRILDIVDTLTAIGSLDYHFDIEQFEVLNLASISLEESKRTISFSKNAIILTTSYHTAMFFQHLGCHVFMFSGNGYYEQKKSGLNLNEHKLEDVIATQPRDLSVVRDKHRERWLKKLASYQECNLIKSHKRYTVDRAYILPIFENKPIHTNIHHFIKQKKKPQPTKIVSKKVFGIGWAKTGTTTLAEALKILGYDHYTQDMCLVDDMMVGNYKNIQKVVDNFESFDDWPWIILYKQLDMLYPHSKFILTIRDSKSWVKSYRNMLRNEGISSEYSNRVRSFLYNLDFPHVSDEQLVERYAYHIQEVKSYFQYRLNDLLIVDWSKGDEWEKLSKFLDKEIPDSSFPHKNRGKYH